MTEQTKTPAEGVTIPPLAGVRRQGPCQVDRRVPGDVRPVDPGPEGFWGEIAERVRVEGEVDQGPRLHVRAARSRSSGSSAGRPTSRSTASTGTSTTRGDQTAIIWEGNEPGRGSKLTYRELHAEVCKFANVLKALGVKKGDRVCIYLQMIPAGRRRHAGLRPHRRDPLGRVRRVQRRRAARPHQRLGLQDADHAGHRAARRQDRHPDEGQRRQGRGRSARASRRSSSSSAPATRCRCRRAATSGTTT